MIRLIHREDDDVTEALQNLFEEEGIDIVLNATVKRISGKSGQSVRIVMEQRGVEKTLEGSHLLVAAGRSPNTDRIGLELAGVELTDNGYIGIEMAALEELGKAQQLALAPLHEGFVEHLPQRAVCNRTVRGLQQNRARR
jgi:pyruvate/2-oxoglutarate dehydrogenase complex dihydrolipoamide dehydrogenase (E3) component